MTIKYIHMYTICTSIKIVNTENKRENRRERTRYPLETTAMQWRFVIDLYMIWNHSVHQESNGANIYIYIFFDDNYLTRSYRSETI